MENPTPTIKLVQPLCGAYSGSNASMCFRSPPSVLVEIIVALLQNGTSGVDHGASIRQVFSVKEAPNALTASTFGQPDVLELVVPLYASMGSPVLHLVPPDGPIALPGDNNLGRLLVDDPLHLPDDFLAPHWV